MWTDKALQPHKRKLKEKKYKINKTRSMNISQLLSVEFSSLNFCMKRKRGLLYDDDDDDDDADGGGGGGNDKNLAYDDDSFLLF